NTGNRPAGLPEEQLARRSMVRMTLNGSRRWNAAGQERTGGFSNYLLGNDSKRWTGIPQYGRVNIPAVYPGIDLVFYGSNNDLEYDFLVAPGADPTRIRLSFSGMESVHIDHETGDLLTTIATGAELRTHRPRVYQQIGDRKVDVRGGYTILENAIAADSNSIYVAGVTSSSNFTPAFNSAYHGGAFDGFVMKLSSLGNQFDYSELLGGSGLDSVKGIAIDSTQSAVVVGLTHS